MPRSIRPPGSQSHETLPPLREPPSHSDIAHCLAVRGLRQEIAGRRGAKAGGGEVKPLAIDLYCGLGGWTEGFLAEGYEVIGFDIERRPYPAQLVLQDVLTLHGSQFKDAAIIVASPPCQAYSHRAMPWGSLWLEHARMDDDGGPPGNYRGKNPVFNDLFQACFRIQREASEAAGRRIPMIIENVKGAQKHIGRAAWHYGSFYLWGDVPALMPFTHGRNSKLPPGNNRERKWADRPIQRLKDAFKNNGGSWFNIAHNTESGVGQNPDGRKVSDRNGKAYGGDFGWDGSAMRLGNSHSSGRKTASAQIAKIPFELARHIASVYKPEDHRAIERSGERLSM